MEQSLFMHRITRLVCEVIGSILTKELTPTLAEIRGLRQWVEDIGEVEGQRHASRVLLRHLQIIERETEREQQEREALAELETKRRLVNANADALSERLNNGYNPAPDPR